MQLTNVCCSGQNGIKEQSDRHGEASVHRCYWTRAECRFFEAEGVPTVFARHELDYQIEEVDMKPCSQLQDLLRGPYSQWHSSYT